MKRLPIVLILAVYLCGSGTATNLFAQFMNGSGGMGGMGGMGGGMMGGQGGFGGGMGQGGFGGGMGGMALEQFHLAVAVMEFVGCWE